MKQKSFTFVRTECIVAVFFVLVLILFYVASGYERKESRIENAVVPLSSSLAEKVEEEEQSYKDAVNLNRYKDGEYSASAFGYSGDIEVVVVIENGEVVEVFLGEYGDDSEYRCYSDQMISDIENNPYGDVDTVSGATFSTSAIWKAYQKALTNAR